MGAARYFSSTYAEARSKFLEACRRSGLPTESHVYPDTGFDGEELSTDVVRIGPDDAIHVLFTMSATHGVEGFCGSGVQVGGLRSGLYETLPDGFAVVLIHAINPYGFSWLRRVTQENVDLNRNHLDHDAAYPVNEEYERLRDAVCPRQWTRQTRSSTQSVFENYIQKNGAAAFQAAVSSGQYSDPQGLFFGGHSRAWSAETMANVISRHSTAAIHVGFIDYHSGLGPHGHGSCISAHASTETGYQRLQDWLGSDKVTSADTGTSVSAAVTGANCYCVAEAVSPADLTMLTLEFGTFPAHEVFDSLRADNWLHIHGELNSEQGRVIKADIRRCFYPDTDHWKTLVWNQSSEVECRFIAGLSSLEPGAGGR